MILSRKILQYCSYIYIYCAAKHCRSRLIVLLCYCLAIRRSAARPALQQTLVLVLAPLESLYRKAGCNGSELGLFQRWVHRLLSASNFGDIWWPLTMEGFLPKLKLRQCTNLRQSHGNGPCNHHPSVWGVRYYCCSRPEWEFQTTSVVKAWGANKATIQYHSGSFVFCLSLLFQPSHVQERAQHRNQARFGHIWGLGQLVCD